MSEAHRSLRRFAGRTMQVVVLRVLAAVLGYATVVLLAKWLSASDYGHYATIMSAVTLAAVACRMGTDIAVVRFLGQYRAQGRPDLSNGIVRSAESAVLLAALVVGALGTVVIYVVPGPDPRSLAYGAAALLILPAFAMSDLQSGIIRSYNRIFMALAPRDIIWRLATLGIAAALVWGGGIEADQRLAPLMIGSGGALVLLIAVQRSYQVRRRAQVHEIAPRARDMPAWRRMSGTVWIMLLARVSFRTVDVLIVGILLSSEAAGMYFIASRTAELMGFLLASLNLVIGPTVAEGHASGAIYRVNRQLAFTAGLLIVTGLPVLLICLIWGGEVLALAGGEYTGAAGVLAILAVGQFFNLAAGSVGVVLNMTGHERVNAEILVSTAVLTMLLTLVATWQWGLIGTACAATSGTIVWNMRAWWAVRRLTRYDPSILGALRFVRHKRARP